MIVKLSDIKKAVNEKLIDLFPDMSPPYGKETVQGHVRPCFFSEVSVRHRTKTKKYNENEGVITLTYLQDEPDELDALEKYDAIREAFKLKLKVNKRYINVDAIEFSWTGKDDNILQIEIEISYEDTNDRKTEHEMMQKIVFKEELENGNA